MSMSKFKGLSQPPKPDYEAFIKKVLLRKGTPERVHFMELFMDGELQPIVAERLGMDTALDPDDRWSGLKRHIAIQRALGYDTCNVGIDGLNPTFNYDAADDTVSSDAARDSRSWMNEHKGPIGSWEDFEKYPWPKLEDANTEGMEAAAKLVPDDMCLIGWPGGHMCEHILWMFGYETLCFMLYDDRDLVQAVHDKLFELEEKKLELVLQCDRVKITMNSDDLGFNTGLMISPDDTREFVLSAHKELVKMSHDAGLPTILHACGKRTDIIRDLIDDVQFDAIHSFEDNIELVTDAKREYGDEMALLGGIDMDFMCRADEAAIRKRVRETLDICQPGGGYALGTGNSVANYIPVDNYFTMLDEGRLYSA